MALRTAINPVFPGKILLFGEYLLLHQAEALAIPFRAVGGQWQWAPENRGLQEKLPQLADSGRLNTLPGFDFEQFKADLQAGIHFESSIPIGYGAGSSGALCAALYHRYCTSPTTDLIALKNQLAYVEGFFHGNSSGVDPLTSYLDTLLHIRPDGGIEPCAYRNPESLHFFLLDSGKSRETAPLVAWFRAASSESSFSTALENEILPVHHAVLSLFLKGAQAEFWATIRQFSILQLEYFKPLVLPQVQALWEAGLQSGQYYLKLCGAGGGGYYLGVANHRSALEKLAITHKIIPLDLNFSA